MSIALVNVCGSECEISSSLTRFSATPEAPTPLTDVGKVELPPEQLLLILNTTFAIGITVFDPLVFPAPVEPPSGKAGFGIPLVLNLNLKLYKSIIFTQIYKCKFLLQPYKKLVSDVILFKYFFTQFIIKIS